MAALNEQTMDVPLIAMNQAWPATAGPAGRLRKINNAIARKWMATQGGILLKTEKRDGFTQLTGAVHDPGSGAISAKTLAGVTLATSFGARLAVVAGGAPFVLSDAAGTWESPTYYAPTQALRAKPIVGPNALTSATPITSTPDSARIGSSVCTAWTDSNLSTFAMIVDDDGTAVKTPFAVAAVAAPLKVVSDGAQSWSVTLALGSLSVNAFDTNGALLGHTTFAAATANYFDVTKNTNTANSIVALAKAGATGFQLITFTWNGSAVTASSFTPATVTCSTGRLAFLRSDRNDHRYYVVTIDGAGPFDAWLSSISDSNLTVQAGPFKFASAIAAAPVEITGKIAPTGNADAVVAMSFLDTTPTPQKNFTDIYTVTAAGSAALAFEAKSLTVASRPFVLPDGSYSVVAYFQSNPGVIQGQVQQSTFFLFNLAAPWQVCGRFDFGLAYADWQSAGASAYWLHLATPNVDPSGGVHIPLAYRATSFTTKTVQAVTPSGPGPQPVEDDWFTAKANTVGIKDWQIGPDSGQAVEYANELLIPGPQATSFTGSGFTSNGVGLAPEILGPVTTDNALGSGLQASQKYQYVPVVEWTDNNGNRVRSQAGSPIDVTLGAGDNRATVTGLMDHVTLKPNLTFALYRTVIQGGIQSSEHHKVTSDLAPVLNSTGSATWTFIDTMFDDTAAVNEILYTDKLYLDRYPCPPFTVGCSGAGRAFVVGPDKAIWFSGEKTEGDALWFSPFQRILLPTSEEPKAVAVIDGYLLIIGDRESVFVVPVANLPDATGAGGVPEPTRLPLSHGCTGFFETYSDGLLFGSTQGGLWTIGRDLKDVFTGAAVKDETDASAVTAMVSDKFQRIAVTLANGHMLVYDTVVGAWYTWTPQTTPKLLTSHKGLLVYADSTSLWRQEPGAVVDQGFPGSPFFIATSVQATFHLGDVRGFKRIWDMQMQGEYKGDHDMTVLGAFDDDLGTVLETYAFTPSSSVPYVYDLPPKIEDCSSVTLTFTDSFPRGPSGGFALEMVSFAVGVEGGLGRLPIAQRIAPT